jgi:putative acetyltransferase
VRLTAGWKSNHAGMPMIDAEAIALQPMTEADIPAVKALHIRSFAALARDEHTQGQIAAHVATIQAADYERDLQRSHLVLAWGADGALLGTAGWLAVADEPATARIRKVFVDPGAARRGLATRLVADAEARARAAGHRRFVVRANVNAVRLYLKLGYAPVRAGTMEVAGGVMLPVVFMEKKGREG